MNPWPGGTTRVRLATNNVIMYYCINNVEAIIAYIFVQLCDICCLRCAFLFAFCFSVCTALFYIRCAFYLHFALVMVMVTLFKVVNVRSGCPISRARGS